MSPNEELGSFPNYRPARSSATSCHFPIVLRVGWFVCRFTGCQAAE